MGAFEEAVRASAEKLGRDMDTTDNVKIELVTSASDDPGLREFIRANLEINWPQVKAVLPIAITDYVALIETNQTNAVCDCQWIVHPDDEGKEEGVRRMRRGMISPVCPVHTKEGFLLGFFKWVMTGDIR